MRDFTVNGEVSHFLTYRTNIFFNRDRVIMRNKKAPENRSFKNLLKDYFNYASAIALTGH